MIHGLENARFPEVFNYFQEISNIPRGSGNVKAISDYLYTFGINNKLETYRDAFDNVIIIKKADKGYEDKEPVMIQGHMDMVAEKESTSNHDFLRDPLDLYVEDGFLKARGTTLGADDGIAVAMMLAILSDKSLKTPRLECVITTDEETGMTGAENIDLSVCKAKRMINLDSETDGEFTAGCAGGARLEAALPLEYEKHTGRKLTLFVNGLKGGHSGDAIHLGRGNAVNIISRLLFFLRDKCLDFGLISIEGGTKDNAIPREAILTISTMEYNEKIQEVIDEFQKIIQAELAASDEGVYIGFKVDDEILLKRDVINRKHYPSIYAICQGVPNGVIAMSPSMPGLTETSTNLGILQIVNDTLEATYLLRSSFESRKRELMDRMKFILTKAGVPCKEASAYPGWPYIPGSPLQVEMSALYEKMFGKAPVITAIHGGLECGLIWAKIPGIDIVSLGPDNLDIHTPKERMDIASAERVYEFVTRFLQE